MVEKVPVRPSRPPPEARLTRFLKTTTLLLPARWGRQKEELQKKLF